MVEFLSSCWNETPTAKGVAINQGGQSIQETGPESRPERLRFEHGVRSILEDSNGHYWFGSWQEGVARFDGKEFTYFTKADGLDRNQVRKVFEDRNGTIWFDTGESCC